MASARNLLNLKDVAKGYGSRSVLREVTLGVAAGERIGVVGRNGDGKSTLLRLIAGVEPADAGALTRAGDVDVALLGQRDELDARRTIREVLVGERAEHEWAGDSAFRDVLDGLMGGVSLELFAQGIDTPIAGLSGGERRRVALARLLLDPPELLALDEPTNHLDVEAVDWLAGHLAARRGSLLVVTHDRWFLDAVCTYTWEVADGVVHEYEGGYAAYVLARAERDRQAGAREDRRRQLVRKELAWLRRGPPARTSKPKFRIESANALIADEPPARDTAELLRFATARLGDKVLDAVEVSLTLGTREVLHELTWRLGPGDRVALVGVNGSGKTSLVRLLAGELEPSAGTIERGATVRLAQLSQDTSEVPGHLRVLESLEEVRGHATLSDGQEISAALLCDRFGFRGEKARTLVRRSLRRRAPAARADAAADGGAERAAARRADERPRHRHAHRARGSARRLAGDARGGQPRPLLRRAGVRRRLRAHRRRRDRAHARRHRAVPRAAPRSRSGARRDSTEPRRAGPGSAGARGAQGGPACGARAGAARARDRAACGARDGAGGADGRERD